MQAGVEEGHEVVVPPAPRAPDGIVALPPAPSLYPPPPPGAPGPPGPAPAFVVRRNGFATASLVLGLLGFFGITALLAVIFGHLALGSIKRSNRWQRGTGMALAGVILGWAYVAILVLALVANPTTT